MVNAVCFVHGWWGLDGPDQMVSREEQFRRVRRWRDCNYVPFDWEAGLEGSAETIAGTVARVAEAFAAQSEDEMIQLTSQVVIPVLERFGKAPEAFEAAVLNAPQAATQLVRRLEVLAVAHGQVDIVAHSLGARVVYHALSNPGAANLVNDVVLLGGALPAYKSWWAVSKHISGTIYNFSSPHDSTLKRLYHPWLNALTSERHGRSIGVSRKNNPTSGIESRLRAVQNIVTKVGSHTGYFSRLADLIDPCSSNARIPTKDWHDEFRWDGVVFRRVRRGVQAEIVQRALTAPIDGGDPLLDVTHINGKYDDVTKTAVRAFQARNGLDVDGLVGVDTWRKLVNKPAKFHTSRGVRQA